MWSPAELREGRELRGGLGAAEETAPFACPLGVHAALEEGCCDESRGLYTS